MKFKKGDFIKHKYGEVKQYDGSYLSTHYKDDWELWKPTLGEWCLFYCYLSDPPVLDMFTHKEENYYFGKRTTGSTKCIPFTGILPIEHSEYTYQFRKDDNE